MATALVGKIIGAKADENKSKHHRLPGKMLRSHLQRRYER